MSSQTRYYAGGYNATAPQQNRAETYDGVAGTYTSWAVDGTVTGTRALTAPEVAALAAQDTQSGIAAKVTAAESGLVSLNVQLAAWKTQLAADVASVTAAGWDVLTAQQRTAIMLRILNGFGTAMTATVDHAIVTGAITPGV